MTKHAMSLFYIAYSNYGLLIRIAIVLNKNYVLE